MGQIVDENGNAHPEIKYYTEHAFPQVYLADNKISFVATKPADTSIVGDQDSIGRIDMQFLCSKRAKEQALEKPTAFVPCGTMQVFEPSQDHLNYYLPQCPNGITNVPGYARVVYENAFPNIDVHFYSNAVAMKVYFVIKPGGNPSDIDLLFTGQDSIGSIGSSLSMYFGPWEMQFPQAIAYQITPSNSTSVLGWLPIWGHNGNGEVTLNGIGSYNPSEDLVIVIGGPVQQPTGGTNLHWATYYGDDGIQCCGHLSTNENATLYHALSSAGSAFKSYPGSSGIPASQNQGSLDWYVSKFNAIGARQWATYYGGSDSEWPSSIKESYSGNEATGAVWVAGYAISDDIPLGQAGGFQQTANAGIPNQYCYDGLLASFDKIKGTLIYSTYFGGLGSYDNINAIDIDPMDQTLYIAGNTFMATQFANNCSAQTNGSFPLCSGTGNPFFQDTKTDPDRVEGFIASFSLNKPANSVSSLTWSTLFGGGKGDGHAIGDDYIMTIKKVHTLTENALYIGGQTDSKMPITNNPTLPVSSHNASFFPLVNPGGSAFFQTNTTDFWPQSFLARFNSENKLSWCTLLGQTIGGFRVLAFNSQHQLYALEDGVSTTYAANPSPLPNTQGLAPQYSNGTSFNYGTGSSTNLICRFNEDLSLGWSTFLPGANLSTSLGMSENHAIMGIDLADRIFVGTSLLIGSVPIIPVNNYYNQAQNASVNPATDFQKYDNYIMAFNANEQPVWATFYGGEYPSNAYSSDNNSEDRITDLALSGSQYLFLTGETFCKYSPYNQCPPGAYCDQTYNPGKDVFIARMGISNLPTGISDVKTDKLSDISVFPNPSSNLLSLVYKNKNQNNSTATLKITDFSGRIIWTNTIDLMQGDNMFTLNIGSLAAGMYLLEVHNQGKRCSVKFIKN